MVGTPLRRRVAVEWGHQHPDRDEPGPHQAFPAEGRACIRNRAGCLADGQGFDLATPAPHLRLSATAGFGRTWGRAPEAGSRRQAEVRRSRVVARSARSIPTRAGWGSGPGPAATRCEPSVEGVR